MLKFVSSAVFALFSAGSAIAQDAVTWQEDIQGWSVAVDRTIDNSCFIVSGFGDEIFLRFQFNAIQQNVQFIVASTQWDSVKSEKSYDIEVAFGDHGAWESMAQGHRWNDILPSLIMTFPVEDQQASNFMKEFTTEGSMSISYNGSEIATLALTGTRAAVASMLDCQTAMSETSAQNNATLDPFATDVDPI